MTTLTLSVGGGLEAGTYAGGLVDLTPFTYAKEGEEPKTLLRWRFGTADGDDTAEGVTSLNTGPRSKAYAWMTGLLGRTPTKGDSLGDWDQDPISGEWTGSSPLVGLSCQFAVIENADGYGKVETVIAPPKRAK